MAVKKPEQGLVFQLYMNRDRAASARLIPTLEAKGFSAIMLTVDAAVAGKRELDQRAKGDIGSAVCAFRITSIDTTLINMGYRDQHKTDHQLVVLAWHMSVVPVYDPLPNFYHVV